MATQYIGARYVPKFFENSSGTSEWKPNTIYEPLTIVTRNGNSYTSKKIVEASVGAPENNPEYWVATGVYNAQFDELRQDIETVRDGYQEADSGLRSAFNSEIAAERTARQNADNDIADDIAAETSARNTAIEALQLALTQETTARTSADSSLQTQIDDLVAPSGAAPSAAEVTNARIGANGVTYTSLGEAIRTQVTNINSVLTQSLKFVPRDTNITTSNLLTEDGMYNVNTAWYTDLQTAFGSNYGCMITFGSPTNQHYQMLYFETGELYFRWIRADGSNAGSWHPVYSDANLSLDNVLMYKEPEARNVESTVLRQIGMYYINTDWYTDLPTIMGSNKVVTILSMGRATSQIRAQYATTETGEIYMRRITANGTVREWNRLYSETPTGYYVAFGDSRTYGVIGGASGQSEYRYPKYIAEGLHMAYGNYAVSGSGLFARESAGTAAALERIQSTDISNADLITIEYGVNDWQHPIGSPTDTGNDTWCGRLYRVIKYINETNPTATLIVIASANTLEGVQASSYGYGYTTSSGWSLGRLIDAEKAVCEKYHVPFISGYGSPITDFNITSVMGDTYHLSETGHKMRSNYLLNQVRTFYTPDIR